MKHILFYCFSFIWLQANAQHPFFHLDKTRCQIISYAQPTTTDQYYLPIAIGIKLPSILSRIPNYKHDPRLTCTVYQQQGNKYRFFPEQSINIPILITNSGTRLIEINDDIDPVFIEITHSINQIHFILHYHCAVHR